jgi:ATP-dependent RNA helicase DeaD
VESLVETLNAHGRRTQALHGGMVQRERDRVMTLFRAQKADLLVATDVAARGLDIEHLSHVVNYDVPASPEVYLHRIGRTGRAGRTGTAITLAEPREHRLLRAIENFTRAKIEMATVPTVADLRARQLDITRASLREQLLAGNLDHVRVVVESLAEEFGIVDVAAAAVKMAHAAVAGDGDDREIPTATASPVRPERAGPRRSAGGQDRGRPRVDRAADAGGPIVRLFIGAGRQAGIRPGDLVGAITGEAGVESRSLGAIEIADRFSLVEVPDALADGIIGALKVATIRGKKVIVRREREG